MTRQVSLGAIALVAITLGRPAAAPLLDWPQWQGPDRTGVSKETGLLQQWPGSGPSVVWTATGLGTGYGSTAVAGDRVFVQGARMGKSFVIVYNRATGKEVWSKPLGGTENNDQGPGPRGTPTVDGDRVTEGDGQTRDVESEGVGHVVQPVERAPVSGSARRRRSDLTTVS